MKVARIVRAGWRNVLVAAMLPCATQAQPGVAAQAGDVQRYLNLIEQEQEAGGLTSSALIEPLTMLGQYYFARQDYDRAYENIARARQILRVNDGFDTLKELPLVAQLVRADEARGRFAEAWELEQGLIDLAKRNAGRIETLPVLLEVADKRIDLWNRYRTGEFPPQIELGCYYNRRNYVAAMGAPTVLGEDNAETRENCSAGDGRTVRLALLIEARSYQMLALDVLLQNGRYASDEMWGVFTQMLQTSYALMARARGSTDAPLAAMMVRLLSHEPRDSAERLRAAMILVQLADMNVARANEMDRFVGFDSVAEQYRQAHEALRAEGYAEPALEALFRPALPVVLPAFASNPLLAITEAQASAYIDVDFEVTRQGNTRRIDITASSAGVERAQYRELEQLIDRSVFRPRLEGGELVAAPFSLRYFLLDEPLDEPLDDQLDEQSSALPRVPQ